MNGKMSPHTLAFIDAIARRVVEMQGATQRPELSRAEAMAITGHRSPATFSAWCRSRRVKAITRGRYRRAALVRAMGGNA